MTSALTIHVVGVGMGDDKIRPAMAIGKEVDIRFAFGYTPLEFRDTLHMLADGKLDASALVTGTVGLGGVAAADRAQHGGEVLGDLDDLSNSVRSGRYGEVAKDSRLPQRYAALVRLIERARAEAAPERMCMSCPRDDCTGCRVAEL